jgi:hypothetical protein
MSSTSSNLPRIDDDWWIERGIAFHPSSNLRVVLIGALDRIRSFFIIFIKFVIPELYLTSIQLCAETVDTAARVAKMKDFMFGKTPIDGELILKVIFEGESIFQVELDSFMEAIVLVWQSFEKL